MKALMRRAAAARAAASGWARASRRPLSVVTPLGWAVIVASVVSLAVGAVVGWLELLLAGVTGALILALCLPFTLGRSQLQIGLAPSRRRFTVGESTNVGVSVHSDGGRARLASLELQVKVGGSSQSFQVSRLPFDDTFVVAGARRGVLQLGPATTVRSDPIGLLERRSAGSQTFQLYVHPETIPLAPVGTGLLRDLEGRPTKDLSMSDLAFHTLREYAPGDDRRYIHWRSSAKRIAAGQSLLVKQFQDTRRTQLLVVVDGNRASYNDPDEDFELAIKVGASIAVQAVRDDIEMTFICSNQIVRRTQTQKLSKHVVLDACARATFARDSLDKLVTLAVSRARETTYAFIVTGSLPNNDKLRRVASKVPGEARTNVLRIEPDGRRNVRVGATTSLLTLTELKDLRLLFRKEGD